MNMYTAGLSGLCSYIICMHPTVIDEMNRYAASLRSYIICMHLTVIEEMNMHASGLCSYIICTHPIAIDKISAHIRLVGTKVDSFQHSLTTLWFPLQNPTFHRIIAKTIQSRTIVTDSSYSHLRREVSLSSLEVD